jgi:hypothetical protein
MKTALVAAFAAALVLAGGAGAATIGGNYLVDQDHGLMFSQNKQNEPAITRDPYTGVLVAGANDEIDEPLCHDVTAPLTSPCPFAPGVGVNGYYRSTDNGVTWSGGTLPGNSSYVGGGDPSLDYGPTRCAGGGFSFLCGTTIYYASLGDPYPEFAGEQILVYRSHDDGTTWSVPATAATDKTSNFADHEWIAVDRSSAHFGRVYVFWAQYCNTCSGNGNVKLFIAHSDDEGQTWTAPVQISAANNNSAQGFRETGQIAVSANDGTVDAFWTENADSKGKYPNLQVVAVSKDGGNTFSNPITIAQVTDYPLRGTPFDVVDLFNRVPGMSARVDCYPHPAADPSSNKVYVVWCDFSGGNGTVQGAVSSDGVTWTRLPGVAVSGRNAFFPAVAVSPDGRVSLAFDALTKPPANDPWQTGVQVYDNYYSQLTGNGSWTKPQRVSTASSNPDASSYNNLMEQFIGDYIGIVAGPTAAYVVWTDERNASACKAVDDYRTAIYTGVKNPVAPNPDKACATSFGNTDTIAGIVNY